MTHNLITSDHIDTYQKDGVVFVKGLFKDYVATLREGIEANMAEPSEFGEQPNLKQGAKGTFFDDYCNWDRIPEFEDVIRNSPAAEVGADLMQSETVQVFHDHVLVKEPGTAAATPWHQDSPYYFVDGQQTISFWTPLDQVRDATLRMVSGSHLWEKPVLPRRWLSNKDFYAGEDIYMPVPDPDAQGMAVVEWEMEPGDAVAFNFKVLHGTRGETLKSRRRAFSLRLVGDDARYVERAGPTSPPYRGHDMIPGQKLREDWFPTIYSRP
jgi:ectoine hydroxylase-related dioxygenase (phytanoyl-CoA dioxygenase family)